MIANRRPRAIHGQCKIVHRIRNINGHALLGILKPPNIIGRARNHHGQTISNCKRPRHHIPGCFRHRVWIPRRNRCIFRPRIFVLFQRPIHLICTHLQKPLNTAISRCSEQRVHTQCIGLHKLLGTHNTPIHMALRSKIHHQINPLHQIIHQPGIANISPHKFISGTVRNIYQIVQIARVRQLIQIDNAIIAIRIENISHKMAANKPGASCNEHCLQIFLHLYELRGYALLVESVGDNSISFIWGLCREVTTPYFFFFFDFSIIATKESGYENRCLRR